MTRGAPRGTPATESKSDGRQARWARHNEERRAQIVAAALELIEESEPGTEVHVQQIAVRAGVNRTVVYRHFAERADLDIAIQQAIVAMLWDALTPSLSPAGTIPDVIDRIVGTYVEWAAAHPSLHHVVDRDHGTGVLEEAIEELAADIGRMIAFVIGSVGSEARLEPAELDALVHGVIGAVVGAVRRWLHRPNPVLSPERLRAMLSRSAWLLIEGNARALGVVLEPGMQVADLIDLHPLALPQPSASVEALAKVAP